ncbi:RNA polymerase sigma factor [Pseudofulvibacter geojedonensis]|uniref:RNA polymerase sigma factor n=1 Tax=Pseudofulvibacter geojedonensis TaxID=1123758 RepID=A0ABW3I0R6_9FLAO
MSEPNINNLCDEREFDSFYKKEVNQVFRFIVAKNNNRDEALDVVQEAFIKIWNNCDKFDVSKAKSYLLSTARNIFFNIKKHEKVVRKHAKQSNNLYIDNDSPEVTLRQKEFKIRLEKAISELTDAQREVFLLNRIEGKKYREIAELLDISVKAVEKRMSKALSVLRDKIEEIK